MHSSTCSVRSNGNSNHLHSSNLPLKSWKTYGFAIAIIIGIGGLAVGGVGAAGYFGAISNLNQIHAIIMMAAGGGGGVILSIIGVVGTVNKCRLQVNKQEIICRVDTQNGLVYGADAWRIWAADVLDKVPPAPEIHWDEDDPYFNKAYRDNYVLLYIPQRIRVGKEEKNLTLQTLQEISSGSFEYFSSSVAEQFGNSSSSGWVLVSKTVIPGSQSKVYAVQKQMVEEQKGFRMPQVVEVTAASLMVFAFTNKLLLYDELSSIYTGCVEKVDKNSPVVVGGGGSAGLNVDNIDYFGFDYGCCGVAALRKF